MAGLPTSRIAVVLTVLALSTSAVPARALAGGPTTPTAPKRLEVEAVSTTEVQLAWKDRSVNEVSFEVWSKKDGDAEWTRAGSVGSNHTSFVAQGLERATTYEFRVDAVNGSGATPAAETVSATTLE